MATTTTNFGWDIPQSTDLVKDGATAIAALGQDIDTAFVDLKGGTTGQVLAKASNTDLDYTWVAQDDSNAIQNAIVDAKGDLIAATAADTPARLAVGTNGQVLTADSTAATGLAWATVSVPDSLGYAAAKNKILNSDFSIWQRGTTFSNPASLAYTADRFAIFYDGTGATRTISQQTFTPGTAPVSGYEGKFFYRYAVSVAGSGNTANLLRQYIEDVRTFAGQTVTVSFWAKAGSSLTIPTVGFTQNFGTGGSPSAGVDTTIASSVAVTTSWQRFTYSVAVPSISGKTLGTAGNDALELRFFLPSGASTFTFDIWGVQVEAGSTATAFQTATGTIQGELAACQRYYVRLTAGTDNYNPLTGIGGAVSTTSIALTLQPPVTMRTGATSIDYASLSVYGGASGGFGFLSVSSLALNRATGGMVELSATVSGATAGGFYRLQPNNAAGYVGVNAEL